MLKRIYKWYLSRRKELRINKFGKQFKTYGREMNVFGSPRIFFPENISIGDNVNLNDGCILNATFSSINIGNNVTISAGAMILAATYDVQLFVKEHKRQHISAPIEIADNVWVCAGAIILPGVKIAQGCIIGAGSVVTHDILEENVLVAGNPGKIIKRY